MPSISNFRTAVVDVTLTHANSANFVTGDVIADTQSVIIGPTTRPARGTINNILVIDGNDVGKDMDIVVLDSDVSLGTEDGAAALSAANAANILSVVNTGETWIDVGSAKIVQVSAFAPIPYNVDDGTIYIGVISRDTAAHSSGSTNALKLRLFISIENS